MKTRIPVLLLVAATAACSGYKAVPESAPAMPAYAFPHSPHVDADVPCAACHDLSKATKLDPAVRHVKIPANVTKTKPCSDCHDSEPKWKLPARQRAYRVSFDHADHLKRMKDCKQCHQKLPETGDTAPSTPPMAACTACHHHQQEFSQARCMPCHVDLKGYKPVTAFRHEGAWLATHGSLARPTAESCAACHDQTYCVACHSPATAPMRVEIIFPERVQAAYIHRGDYVSRHMVDANANPQSCRSCHGSPFCDTCHAANGFSPSATGAKIRPLSHAAGWVNLVDGGKHRQEARRDISNCAACHDQTGPTNTCLGCHKVGGSADKGKNGPHPKAFLDKHTLSDVSKNDMCKQCH
jgi:hypothetical protein